MPTISDIPDIASVEMLRGPQSTLYGRNTMAGVINVTTLSPMRYQGWRLMAEYGSGEAIKISAGWYHKFNSRAGLAIVGAYGSRDGVFTNQYNGKKVDHERNWSGRVKFHWRFKDGWNLQNTAAAGYLKQGGYPYEWERDGRDSLQRHLLLSSFHVYGWSCHKILRRQIFRGINHVGAAYQ